MNGFQFEIEMNFMILWVPTTYPYDAIVIIIGWAIIHFLNAKYFGNLFNCHA